MALTSDPRDPRLTHGADTEPVAQAEVYLVLSEDERGKGFVRPVRRSYWHTTCGRITTMGLAIAETYARDPGFYKATYCVWCMQHRPGRSGRRIPLVRHRERRDAEPGTPTEGRHLMSSLPQDPDGTTLAVDLSIEDGAWRPYLGGEPLVGHITRIGVLPGGMTSGRPSLAMCVVLDDGRAVFVEQSWRNFSLAAVALIARWGTP